MNDEMRLLIIVDGKKEGFSCSAVQCQCKIYVSE